MGEGIRKFVPRAPRYVLRTHDRNIMRFGLAGLKGPAHIETTALVNLSETGAAFLAPAHCDLKIGDVIKVEIPIPNEEQIAWFAKVVRIAAAQGGAGYSNQFRDHDETVIIALKFEELPEPHSKAIRRGIEASFLKALREQQAARMLYYRAFLIQNMIPLMFYLALSLAAFAFIYYFSLPSENYDGSRGAPWGQRFKF